MNRGTLKTLILTLLGTSDDDPAFDDAVLDPIAQQAYDSVLSDINQASSHYLSKSVTLAAGSPSSHLYTFATQAAPVIDFASWLEVRYDDSEGAELSEARLEELRNGGGDLFAITGPDEALVLQTSPDSPAGTPLFFRYSYRPADLVDDNSALTGVPKSYRDVVALEALFAYGLGGEQRLPPELFNRWRDRKAQMLARVGRRGVQVSRTRVTSYE